MLTEVPLGQWAMFIGNMPEKVTFQVGTGSITIETGKIAKQADGAVTVQLGETTVLVAAVAASNAKPGQDFFPLTVDYREKAAAAGKFPGGYFKREGRPTEKEILTSRLIDRPIRPLFPRGWYNEVQVQSVLLSADGENDPDIISIIGVMVFTGLTAYDVQKLKRIGEGIEYEGVDTANVKKMSVMGALTLYLDFVNLFLMLLRLFGRRN